MQRTTFPENVLPANSLTESSDAPPLDKRLVHERNRTAVLQWLHRFGWLTSRMIAALVWADSASATVMTRRTLQQLVEEKLVIARAMTKGGTAYLLA